MPRVLTILNNNASESEDNISWPAGDSPIVFERPFANTNYTLDVHCGDAGVTVKEKPGTRTVTGVTVTVTGGSTTTGYFYVEGLSDEYVIDGVEDRHTRRGKMSLIEGENTVHFGAIFRDTEYMFTPQVRDEQIYEIKTGRQKDRTKVYSASVVSDFRWIVHGIRE